MQTLGDPSQNMLACLAKRVPYPLIKRVSFLLTKRAVPSRKTSVISSHKTCCPVSQNVLSCLAKRVSSPLTKRAVPSRKTRVIPSQPSCKKRVVPSNKTFRSVFRNASSYLKTYHAVSQKSAVSSPVQTCP